MADFELIIGVHSIKAALENPKRENLKIYLSDESEVHFKSELKSNQSIEVIKLASHKIQEEAKTYFAKLELEYQRVPSQCFLVSRPLDEIDMNDFYEFIAEGNKRVLCLDQISDVHNGGAILRTASFYGIDAVILPSRKSFSYTPGYFRITSGAHEYLKLIQVNNLSKTLRKLQSLRTIIVGLSEHSEESLEPKSLMKENANLALVLGKEQTGISHAVLRMVDHKLSLHSQGDIKSLNVSVAAAISLEKCFAKS